VTYGALFTIQPFGNDLVTLDLTGEQLLRLLEQQWQPDRTRFLQLSRGFSYTWDAGRPDGRRVVEARLDGQPLVPGAIYRVAVNSFMADGGDNYSVFREGTNRIVGPTDLDALVEYILEQSQPITSTIEERITRLGD
jgi:5'-nucleotidase